MSVESKPEGTAESQRDPSLAIEQTNAKEAPPGSLDADTLKQLEQVIVAVEHVKTAQKKKKKKKKKKAKKEKQANTLGTSRGIETMFRTSYRVHMDLSSLADTKANIMISINGIIMSILLASISPKIDANPWLLLPTSVLLFGCLLSLVYAVLSARPRVSSQTLSLEEVRRNNANILFFGNFVNLREDDFIQGMTELLQNTDRLYYNMIRDIYGLGRVLAKKFRLLRISYTIFMIALILGVMTFIGVYIWVVLTGQPSLSTAP